MSHDMTKPTKCVRPAKTQTSLIRVFDLPQWVVKDPRVLHADSEDSDQTGRADVFAGCTGRFVGFVMSLDSANGKDEMLH